MKMQLTNTRGLGWLKPSSRQAAALKAFKVPLVSCMEPLAFRQRLSSRCSAQGMRWQPRIKNMATESEPAAQPAPAFEVCPQLS